MPDNKTQPTTADVAAFIGAVEPPVRRADARVVCDMMARLSGHPPVMWGPTIIGFGSYHYRYDSGREGDMCRIGFSPRKAKLVVYLTCGQPHYADLLARLGKYKTGGGACTSTGWPISTWACSNNSSPPRSHTWPRVIPKAERPARARRSPCNRA